MPKEILKQKIIDLQTELKTIWEESSLEELQSFLRKHKNHHSFNEIINSPLDKKGSVALHLVVKDGEDELDKIQLLIDHGANISKEDLAGRNVLHIACTRYAKFPMKSFIHQLAKI